ncbi:glycosyltransferase family 2 protein [Nonomuraea sp. NPDC049421]|uniref:glycosyltransferase n=1 Tax=Nonomuraea sp. NPDC049421 TaxID=3155275 RepID=UPI003449A712
MVRISVIIPTRDRAGDLARCLEALAECAQDGLLPAWGGKLHEVIVVDDASAVAGVHDARLPILALRNERRAGAALSRTVAAARASGDVLAFLDDDAAPRGDWLAVVARHLRGARVAITGRVLPFDGGLLSRARQARHDARYAGLEAGTPVDFFAGGNSAVLAEVFREVNGFTRLTTGGDNSLAEALAARGTPVCFEPDLVIAHRNGKGLWRACADAWSAGAHHPVRLTPLDAARMVASAGVGAGGAVRTVNRMLGALHATGRAVPRGAAGATGAARRRTWPGPARPR